ncbi:MAG: hydrogenase maturation protease [Roseiflexus sp.]
MQCIIIIGYGNDLRGDDAAGRVAADMIAALHLPDVTVLSMHQLTPELASLLAQAHGAIFLDADASGCQVVRVTHILPQTDCQHMGHRATPEALLTLARSIYGRSPDGWLISIPAIDFTLGAPLSPQAHNGVVQAVTIVQHMVTGADKASS